MTLSPDIETLFNSVKEEFDNDTSEHLVELDLAQLHQLTHAEHEKIAVLFDLALEELRDPGSEQRYVDLAQLTEKRIADSSSLSKALKRFERIVQAPFQLKDIARPSVTTSYRQPITRAAIRVVPASPRERLAALLIDFSVVAAATFAIVVPFARILESSPLRELGFTKSSSIVEYLPLTATYLKGFLIALIVYPIISFKLRGKTIGLAFRHIKLISDNGAPPRMSQILVRSCLTPLSIVTMMPISIIRRKKTISDLISRTTVSRI